MRSHTNSSAKAPLHSASSGARSRELVAHDRALEFPLHMCAGNDVVADRLGFLLVEQMREAHHAALFVRTGQNNGIPVAVFLWREIAQIRRHAAANTAAAVADGAIGVEQTLTLFDGLGTGRLRWWFGHWWSARQFWQYLRSAKFVDQ